MRLRLTVFLMSVFASLLVIVVVLAAVTVTSLLVTRGENESDSTPRTSAQ